eukprot:s6607_g3.t5
MMSLMFLVWGLGFGSRSAIEAYEPKMSAGGGAGGAARVSWRASFFALAHLAVAGDADSAECKDRDDRWSAYGTSCERMKAMCEDDFYGELVRSWCPLTCGACRTSQEEKEDGDLDVSNATATATASESNSNVTEAEDSECDGGPAETETAVEKAAVASVEESNESLNGSLNGSLKVTNASADHRTTELPLPRRTGPGNWTSLSRTGEHKKETEGHTGRGFRGEQNLSAGKAILLLEELDEAAEVSGGKGPLAALDALGKHAVGALSSTLDALSLNLMNLTQDLGNWTESSAKEPKGGKGAVAQMLDFLLPDMDQEEVEEKKVCPEAAKLREGRQWAQESGSGSISLAGNQKGWILLSPSEGDECVGFSSHFLQRLRQLWSRKPRTASARRLACRVAFAEGWERVLGDVYGGDQFSGGYRHSAESVEDCAWKCLTQPGCGSFEWSESSKRCFRNSQTRPTHEADRAGFVREPLHGALFAWQDTFAWLEVLSTPAMPKLQDPQGLRRAGCFTGLLLQRGTYAARQLLYLVRRRLSGSHGLHGLGLFLAGRRVAGHGPAQSLHALDLPRGPAGQHGLGPALSFRPHKESPQNVLSGCFRLSGVHARAHAMVMAGVAQRGHFGHFLHGVASGDPLADAIVLWTRFTPMRPAEEKAYKVRWLLWASPASPGERHELAGEAAAAEEFDFTVKVDVSGLRPGSLYTYRFECGQAKSPQGEFRLPLPPSQPMARLSYAVFSCANRGFGNFRAYAAAVDRSRELQAPLDFWLHLGDYIYEYGDMRYPEPSETVLPGLQPSEELVNLQQYRQRHAHYRLDPDLQLLSASAPMISIWDDHEVANDDFKDGAENHRSETQGAFEPTFWTLKPL